MCQSTTLSLSWRGGDHTVVLEGFASNTQTCAIMQEVSSEVELLDLPSTWTLRKFALNTVKLPCQHTFHPTALAQHFAYRCMRCPVCRAGGDKPLEMHRSDVPVEVAAAILKHVQDMNDADLDSDSDNDDFLDVACVREMLTIVAEIQYDGSTLAAFTSRLIPNVETDDVQLEKFAPHRSFQRLLLTSAQRSNHHGITIRFQAMHPVMPEPMISQHIPVTALVGEFPMRSACTGSQVLSSVQVTENDVCVNVDIAAVRSICCGAVAAHLEHLMQY